MLRRFILEVEVPEIDSPAYQRLVQRIVPEMDDVGFEGALSDADVVFFTLGLDDKRQKRDSGVRVMAYRLE